MNGPDDFRDEELSRRYRHLPPELPNPATDAAIQAAARQAVSASKRRPALPGFYGGLALAASVTLVVSLLLPSWRSGRLQEQVAVPAPAAKVVVADADNGVAAPPAPAVTPAPADVASTPVPARVVPARSAKENRQAAGSVTAVALPPAAAPVPLQKTEAAGSAEAVVAAGEPALADQSVPEAAARAAEASRNEGRMAERAREEPEARAKARLAMAPAPAPMAAAPAPLQKANAMTTDALLLAGRYGEVLALLQAAPAAADPALESRRDLLRQLVAGRQALRCSPAAGPRSAQVLCQFLRQREQSAGTGQAGATPAQLAALRQALEAEGQDPAPWLQALARLAAGP